MPILAKKADVVNLPSRFVARAMNHPESFIDPDAYSLLDYLESTRKTQQPEIVPESKERHITIYHFTGYVRQALDTIRQHSKSPSIPSRNAIITACIEHEVDMFYSGYFGVLAKCKAEFKRDAACAVDIDAHAFVDQFLGLPLEIPSLTMDKSSRVVVTLGAVLDAQVGNASERNSISKENIALICCIRSLSLQTRDCHSKHIERARETMKMLFTRVEMAGKIAETCVQGLRDGAF